MAEGATGGMSDALATGRQRLDAVIHGRVQGVGYRYFVRLEAHRLGIDGWVANRPDGGVACRAEGDRAKLEVFLEALRDGPPGAFVERIDVTWSTVTGGSSGFVVRASAHSGD